MRVYVAGPITAMSRVRAIQDSVVDTGHELTLDWTRQPDTSLTNYAMSPEVSSRLATQDLRAVLAADAVLIVASEPGGRGVFVEFGAALSLAEQGELDHVVLVGPVHDDSVFFYHPAVRRVSSVDEWLAATNSTSPI